MWAYPIRDLVNPHCSIFKDAFVLFDGLINGSFEGIQFFISKL